MALACNSTARGQSPTCDFFLLFFFFLFLLLLLICFNVGFTEVVPTSKGWGGGGWDGGAGGEGLGERGVGVYI